MNELKVIRTLGSENPQVPEDLSCLGPNWSDMTPRQKRLYGVSGGLSEAELDVLWNDVDEEANNAAA